MEYKFQKFEGRNVRLEDRITITKSHSIGFPQKFYNDNNIKKHKYVVFYWDMGSQSIGVHFADDENEKNKFSVIHSKDGYGGSVVARSFFKTYGLDPKEIHGRYDWKKVNIDGVGEMFVIQLKK